MPTVVVVDDHPVVRAGVRTVLDAAEDITLLAEGTTTLACVDGNKKITRLPAEVVEALKA